MVWQQISSIGTKAPAQFQNKGLTTDRSSQPIRVGIFGYKKCARNQTHHFFWNLTHIPLTTMSAATLTLSFENEFQTFPCDKTSSTFLSSLSLRVANNNNNNNGTSSASRPRAGMDLVIALDRSGSMHDMPTAHTAMKAVADGLQAQDRLAIVSFNSTTVTFLPLTRMDDQGKQQAHQIISTIHASGGTNLCGGLLGAIDILQQQKQKQVGGGLNPVSSVILMTDGQANQGITDPSAIIQQSKDRMTGLGSTSIYCFGFGANHNSSLLASVSSSAGGAYYFIRDAPAIPRAFAACVGGLMRTVAQGISVRLTPISSDIIINTVHTTLPAAQSGDGLSWLIDVGDMFEDEQRDLLVEIAVPTFTLAAAQQQQHHQDQDLVRCQLEFTTFVHNTTTTAVSACDSEAVATASRTTVTSATTISLPRTVPGSLPGAIAQSIDIQRNRMLTSNALQQARNLADQGKMQEAKDVIARCHATITASPSAATCVGMVQDLVSVQFQMQTPTQYQNEGQHRLINKSRKHGLQRECEVQPMDVDTSNASSSLMTAGRFASTPVTTSSSSAAAATSSSTSSSSAAATTPRRRVPRRRNVVTSTAPTTSTASPISSPSSPSQKREREELPAAAIPPLHKRTTRQAVFHGVVAN
jgi:Mg-chelatase subunit ChlD